LILHSMPTKISSGIQTRAACIKLFSGGVDGGLTGGPIFNGAVLDGSGKRRATPLWNRTKASRIFASFSSARKRCRGNGLATAVHNAHP
jgi:hypothetical protein